MSVIFLKSLFLLFQKSISSSREQGETKEVEQRMIIFLTFTLYIDTRKYPYLFFFFLISFNFGLVILCIMLLCPSQSALLTLAGLLSPIGILMLFQEEGALHPKCL